MSSSYMISEHGKSLIEHHRIQGLPTPSLDHPPIDSTPVDIDALWRKTNEREREVIKHYAMGVIAAGFVARETRLTDPAVFALARTVQADWLDGMLNQVRVIMMDYMQGEASWRLPVMSGQARGERDAILTDWRFDRGLRDAADGAVDAGDASPVGGVA